MAERDNDAPHENYIKRYLENVVTSTKMLVEGDKANAFKFMSDAVEHTRALIDRIVQEIEVAEGEIWDAISVPIADGKDDASLTNLEELRTALVELTEKVDKLAAARRGKAA